MTEAQWWELFTDELPDGFTLAGFADWLEERGDSRADAVRWVAVERPTPYKTHSEQLYGTDKSYDWWHSRVHDEEAPLECKPYITVPVLKALPRPDEALDGWSDGNSEESPGNLREYPSRVAAYQALLVAVVEVGVPSSKEVKA